MTYKELTNNIDTRVTERVCLPWPAQNQKLEEFAQDILSRRFQSMLVQEDYDY